MKKIFLCTAMSLMLWACNKQESNSMGNAIQNPKGETNTETPKKEEEAPQPKPEMKKVKTSTETTFLVRHQNGKTEKIKGPAFALTFDKNGNLTQAIDYNPNGSQEGISTFEYDQHGNKIKETYQSQKSSSLFTYKYQYSNGRKTQEERHEGNGGAVIRKNFTYDNKQNISEISEYESDGRLYRRTTFKYDEKNNKTEEARYNADGSLSSRTTYKYDDKGNQTEYVLYSEENVKEDSATYQYEYDQYGNWTKRTKTKNGSVQEIIERQVTYF